ncbi:hypothetical protein [Paenibacillus hunanensis]|uniref:HPP family protein n=1 Tax=Paenibacillus hunanensis TaxID=539262 RepID=A0ABU1ISH3_9BACL|nr:hypothetical protein [Paenibacillus hunanensis]MDR6242201.1 hypothetical protein [Paenibacillus hunanensis]GGJ06066.1 hypothetical protein GCM10008022_13810 [Paenibacillus hunanensis]
MNAVDSKSYQPGRIAYVIAITFILFMVGLAEFLQRSEIILPEVAAMAIAMWVYREPGWIRRPSVIFIAPTVTAMMGLIINQFQIAFTVKVILTLIAMMLFLRAIRSNFAPAIATGLLPLAVHTEDGGLVWIVLSFTLILMAVVVVLQLHKNLPASSMIQYKYMIIFLAIALCWLGICWIMGNEQLAVIPPLFVVVYESLQKQSYSVKIAGKQVLTLTLSATIGTTMLLELDSQLLATLIDMLSIIVISRLFHIRIPALYAIPLLTFIFPIDKVELLPLFVFCASLFMLSLVLLYKLMEKKVFEHKYQA